MSRFSAVLDEIVFGTTPARDIIDDEEEEEEEDDEETHSRPPAKPQPEGAEG